MTSSNARAFALALGVALLVTRPALAEPSAADLESARALVKEGRALRAQGDLRGALEKFKAGHALGQTAVTALELARTYEMLGALVEAREICLSVARMPVESDETERSVHARDEAEKLAQALRPRIPSLVVQVVGPPPDAMPEVRIDGVLVPPAAFGEPLKANPREHTIVVMVPGFETSRADVTLAEGETRSLLLTLTPLAPMGREAPESEPPRGHSLVTVGIVVGSAGAVVSLVAGTAALVERSKLDNQCVSFKCPAGEPASTLSSAKAWGTIATVGFGVAVVGAGLIGVGILTGQPKARSTGISPWIGVGSAGVRGSF